MNKNTYHFEGLRLDISPQTRINSQANSPGFTTLNECILFCNSIGFDYTVYYYTKDGVKEEVYESI